jgi:hypothetical protein
VGVAITPLAKATVTPSLCDCRPPPPHTPPSLAVLMGVAIVPVMTSIAAVTINGEAINREEAWECIFPRSVGLVMAREGQSKLLLVIITRSSCTRLDMFYMYG